MKKKYKKPFPNDMTFTFCVVPGAIGYKIYGIAPIPVRLDVGNMPTRIEATRDGYNLYGVKV